MDTIPVPKETGSDGTQEAGSLVCVEKPKSPVDGLPITKIVSGLAATRAKNLGGDVAASLLAGSFSQLNYHLNEYKEALATEKNKCDDTKEKLAACRERVAVLDERVRTVQQNRHLKNFCITAGTAMIGVSVEFHKNQMTVYAYTTGIFGIILILLGWVSTGGAEK